MTLRLILVALLASSLTVAACGKKGDPIPPSQQEKKEKKTS